MVRLGFTATMVLTALTGCGETPNYHDDAVKLVAARWGVEGAAACAVRLEQMKAGGKQFGDEFKMSALEGVEPIIEMIVDEVADQSGMWATYSARRKFEEEHENDGVHQILDGIMACSEDIIAGSQDAQRGVQPSSIQKQKSDIQDGPRKDEAAPKNEKSRSQQVRDNPDRLSETELRQTHTPFAALMDGRWATEGRRCDDPENMNFDVVAGTFERGKRSGTFRFENMLLSMDSAKGKSVGRVTVLDPETIEIDWVDWKVVRYKRC